MAYITATHLLEHVHPKTLVVNDPAEVRNAPEKLFVTRFEGLLPPTLIAADRREILAFRAEHEDIVVKPLFGNGGAGVFHVKPEDENLGSLLEMFAETYREPIIVQRYLPEIRDGDKRIILVDGEPVGGVSRMPQAGEARANFHAGGAARKTTLTQRERDICAQIGPALRDRGLVFVGIDVIGDYLTEINVTSPTGIQEINRPRRYPDRGDDLGRDRAPLRRVAGLASGRGEPRSCFPLPTCPGSPRRECRRRIISTTGSIRMRGYSPSNGSGSSPGAGNSSATNQRSASGATTVPPRLPGFR